MTEGGAHVVLDHVSRAFAGGRTLAVSDISLRIARHETLVLLGPSGCGKTTLLRLIAGLLRPDTGQILVDGKPPQPGQESAIVFQSFRLLPWRTVRENVDFALADLPGADRQRRVEHYLGLVGLSRFADAYPAALSGGMRQRAALARALAREPSVLLMDEPFASLDAQSRELMQIETMRMTETDAPSPTVVFVTHSVDEALMLGDRIVLMSPRPGRIAEVVEVPFVRPRWRTDPRSRPEFAALRQHLWSRLREMVLSDPESDFYGRSASD